jgi:small subunit ribosomal protein S3
MGQKVHPRGLRLGIIEPWDSRWFASKSDFGDMLVEDYKIREFLMGRLKSSAVSRVEIEKAGKKIRIFIHTAKPGIVIGRNGSEIEKIKAQLEKMTGKTVAINVVEVKSPDLNAQLISENIASQLERRISFRKAMKQAMIRTMRLGAKGIKTSVSGRLGGVEIARCEHYHEGTIPLQTLRANIDYGFAEASTTYGKIGVKVWVYNGMKYGREVKEDAGAIVKKRRERPSQASRDEE